MKIAEYGTTIVVLYAIANGLHGLAHVEIPVPLSLLQGLFVGIVIFLSPFIAAVLFYRMGSWLLLSAMTGSLLFGVYNHYMVISPDHFTQVSFAGWGLLLQVTALLIALVDGLGCGVGVWALGTIPQQEKAL
jgi:hypothetical protein